MRIIMFGILIFCNATCIAIWHHASSPNSATKKTAPPQKYVPQSNLTIQATDNGAKQKVQESHKQKDARCCCFPWQNSSHSGYESIH